MNNKRGFTLIEVMIVIGIIGIMAAISAPMISGWVPNYQLKGAVRDLYSNMQKVKSEAVKRNVNVAIAFTTVDFPTTGGSYRVFIDDGAGGGTSGDATQNGTEATIFQVSMPALCSLTSASFNGGVPLTGYNAKGLPLGNRTGTAIMRNNKSRWYSLAMSNAGYVKIKMSSDGTNWE